MTFLEIASLLFSLCCLVYLVLGLGKRIIIPETILAFASINYLVMPVIVFHVFNKKSQLAVLWQTVMPVNSNTYFHIVLPALLGLSIGLLWPLRFSKTSDIFLLDNVKSALTNKSFLGFVLIALGVICSFFYKLVPPSLTALFYMGNLLLFIGIFYLLYSPLKYKWLVLVFGTSILILQSIRTGMYGELIYWSYFILIYLIISKKPVSIIYKVGFILVGIFMVLLIQSIKHEYRMAKSKADARLFFSLVSDRLSNPSELFAEKQLYNVATRGNQGFLMARTIHYVPKREPYAHGETIVSSIAASLVPRLFWKDKPALGGKENTCRFLGDCGKRDYSYNIGQIGEGYANFGPWGNVLYLFFLGLFINWSLSLAKRISIRTPTLLLWIPFLYFASLSMETDLLTFLNTIVKGAIFTALIYGLFRLVFHWKI